MSTCGGLINLLFTGSMYDLLVYDDGVMDLIDQRVKVKFKLNSKFNKNLTTIYTRIIQIKLKVKCSITPL